MKFLTRKPCFHAAAEAGLEPLLDGKIAFGMPRPRHLTGEAEAAPVIEPAARRNQAIDQAADPLRDQPTGPQAALGRRMIQGAVKTLPFGGVEQRSGAGVELAPVAQPLNPGLVVAPDQNTEPALRVSRHRGREFRRTPTRHKPERLKMGPPDRVLPPPVQTVQLVPPQVFNQIYPALHPP